MVMKKSETVAYEAFENGHLSAPSAKRIFGVDSERTIIRHRVDVLVRYLIEKEDGERVWRAERKQSSSVIGLRDDEDEDEDEDEGEYKG